MKYASLISIIISFAISVVICPLLIRLFHRLNVGQTIRDEGPGEHLKKNGTPILGGLSFIAGIIVICIIFGRDYPKMIPVLLTTLGFALVGFIDDFLKLFLRRSDGLKAWQKLVGQLIVSVIFCIYLMTTDTVSTAMVIPFTGGKTLELGWAFIPIFLIIALGTDNGVNLTDGLDGLSSSVTIPVAAFFMFASMRLSGGIEPIAGAIFGGLLGYLIYNEYPARLFMGDTGSLALGGFVLSAAFMMQLPIFILIVGFVYFVEIVSDILQVIYFRATHGKRLLRMAPLHHHFELCGWPETRVVIVFSASTILLCVVAFMAL